MVCTIQTYTLLVTSLIFFLHRTSIVNSEPVPELGQDDEFFTAASDMHLLLRVERKLGEELLKYMQRERAKLESLERQIKEIERLHQTLNERETDDWISHPHNAYGIMHRLLNFWPNFQQHAVDDNSRVGRENLALDLKSLDGTYPSVADLRGALAAIVRIQDTYNITASEFIESMGTHMHKLGALELFQMGYLWSELGDHHHAREWFMESVKRFPKKVKVVGFLEKASLYEYLAWSEYKLFRVKDAIKHTKYVLKIKPHHKPAQTNLRLYQEYAEKLKREPPIDLSKANMGEHSEFKKKINYTWEVGKHNLLCSGKLPMEEKIARTLTCSYKSHQPKFILKPLKVEIAYTDPYIELYHDLLTNKEIKYIKRRARPLLARATVHDPKTGNLTYANYRISKSAWIRPDKDPAVDKLFKHLQLVTGLSPRSYEPLQIANYGLAGQYEPHFDHATTHKPKRFEQYGGNRLATMLLYLSEVEMGGATVFTKTGPGVVIAPRKGTGVFWYNLMRNGEGNPKTEHAGCPVVLGEKWVSNIWMHERYNEFSRRCTLNREE